MLKIDPSKNSINKVEAYKKLKQKKNKKSNAPNRFGPKAGYAIHEAYNLTRTNLLFALQNISADGAKVVGVTSSVPGEGKTNVAINLAYSLAETGAKTLLMEGDLRRPSISTYLKLEKTTGLSEYLLGKQEANITVSAMSPNLHLLLSGAIPLNPALLLQSEQFEHYIIELRKLFDYIIIDLPPVLGLPDALSVSRFTDGIAMVVRHKFTSKQDIRESVRQLLYVKAKMLGFVYNDFVAEGLNSYRYSYSGGRYYKKYEKYEQKD